jgi:predicted RNase H-like nuclease
MIARVKGGVPERRMALAAGQNGSMLAAGIDLAWAERTARGSCNESRVVLLDLNGRILDAGWTTGVQETVEWAQSVPSDDVALFVDAALVVNNDTGQRPCDKHVGQRYGRWGVSCNSINTRSPRRAGVVLRERLETLGWRYDDGSLGPSGSGRRLSECYPYTTLVGVGELGYDIERPRYKRKPKSMRIAEFRPLRAAACDDLVARVLRRLTTANPPLDLRSHPVTARLADEPSPLADSDYKHREDLIDAALCAWTAAL